MAFGAQGGQTATASSIVNKAFGRKRWAVLLAGAATVAQTTTLVNQIAPTATGAAIAANTSFIGNYALAPMPTDPTLPSPTPASGNGGGPSVIGPNPQLTITDFRNTGVNMSAE